jgi:uncharacterized repeat protein (TIGR01451 family)
LVGFLHIVILTTFAFSCSAHADIAGTGSWVMVNPETILADGRDTAYIQIYLEDALQHPITGRARDIKVQALNTELGVSIGTVTEIGDGFYETTISASHPGSTVLVVILGTDPLDSQPVVLFLPRYEGYTPVFSPSRDENTYHITAPPVVVDDAITLSGLPAASSVHGATVRITENKFPGDQLGFVADGQFRTDYNEDGIAGSVTDTGEIILTGRAAVEDYIKALRSVAFYAQFAYLGPRTIEFSVRLSDPDLTEIPRYRFDPVTGHYYQYVSEPATWEEAKQHADQSTLFGLQGYLVTITSQQENELVHELAQQQEIWLGASQIEVRKEWRWVTGPENGVLFYRHPWMISGQYGNWRNGRPRGDHKRNYMYMQTDGLWDDDYGSSKRGYVIEYGGMEGDPPVILSATIRMNVKENRPPTADFEVQPGPLRFGEPISFTDKSHDPEGAELTYRWAFGDNTPWVSEQHPVHTFDRPGTYIVTLIVTDPGGLSSMKTHTVVVTTDVTGRVFHDKNKDGQWDPGEEGLPGSDYVVRLVGVVIATAPDPEAGHTLDRESGIYYFRSIPAGAYSVMVTRPDSMVPETPPGWEYTDPALYIPIHPAIVPGLPVLDPGVMKGPDFGFATDYAEGALISGTVFRDDGGQAGIPNNGLRDGDEVGLRGIRIRLFDKDGRLLGSTLTDARGQYTLSAYEDAPGMYLRLVLNSNDLLRPTGYTPGGGSDPVQLDAFTSLVEIPLTSGTYDGYDFGVVPAMRVTGGGSGMVGSGGVTAYPLNIYTGTHGTLSFDIASPRRWHYAVYRDLNGNGAVDPDEPSAMGETLQVGPDSNAFIVTVRPPSGEPEGTVDFAQVNITFVYEGNAFLKESDTVSITTALHSARLRLSTMVRNATRNWPPGPDAFTETHVQAHPGDSLEYKVEYENVGVSPVTQVRISAAIPTGTSLDTDSYGSDRPVRWIDQQGVIRYPSVVIDGQTFWLDLGTVLPGQRGSLTYRVILQ